VDLGSKLPIIEEWALGVSRLGIFNFLLSDSRYLYAHRSTHLFYVQRECISQTECLKGDEPLTGDEAWQPLPEAKIAVILHGEKIY
jgi:predicted glutamine amidotransferase